MIDDDYEPLVLFRDRFKGDYAKNTSVFFEALVQRAGIDESANRETVAVIRSLEKKISEEDSRRSRWKLLRALTVVVLAASLIVTGLFVGHLASPQSVPNVASPLWSIASLVTLVGTGLFLAKKLNPTIRTLDEQLAGLKGELAAKMHEAWEQLAPLNRLYDWGMIAKLVQEVVPGLVVDPFFSLARLGELRESFGWSDDFNDDKSVLFAQSGEINGNPLVVAETLNFEWGTETYHGSLVISWQELETYRDSKGKTQTRWVTRTQTLHASVTKPKPHYTRQKFLIYGNEAAPDLSFSRNPSALSDAGEGFFDKWRMSRAVKKLDKLSRKLDDGSGFTIMSNREFDAVFGALDRNHEIQFRVLFTPLAQQQMVTFLKDKTVGYGDDFRFVKSGMINVVQPAHLAGIDITAAPDLFKNYDIAVARRFFDSYSNEYFKHFFFALAPLLTIPIYHQSRSHGDIYEGVRGRAASFWEHEAIANYHGQASFRHPDSITENVLKTRPHAAGQVAVTAHGFRGEDRVEFVKKLGGDGKWHNVPVQWTEYIAVQRTRTVAVRETDGLTLEDFERKVKTSPDWQSFFRDNQTDGNRAHFRNSIVSVLKD